MELAIIIICSLSTWKAVGIFHILNIPTLNRNIDENVNKISAQSRTLIIGSDYSWLD